MKRVRFLFLFLLTSLIVKGQVPPYIPYQAIARDLGGQVKVNSPIQVEFKIFNTMLSGISSYDEVHSTTTNDFGYFNLRIGSGVIQSGLFNSINWQTGDVSYEVWVDMGLGYTQLGGRTGFLSVPYAMYAANSNPNPTLTINAPNSISNTSPANYSITVPSPTLSITGNSVSVSNGNSITLPTYVAGTGISISGSTITNTALNQTVSISGPGVSGFYPNFTITPAGSNSITSSNSNIVVTGSAPNFTITSSPSLSIVADQLSLSNGNTVTIPTTSITQGTNINVSGVSPNYTVSSISPTLAVTGNATISGTYPNQTIGVPAQTLSIAGNTLNLSAGGGSVTLPTVPTTTISSGSNVIVSGSNPSYTIASVTPTLTVTGNATISGTYPNQIMGVPAQTLSIAGNTLNLSAGGGSVTLPSSSTTTITQGSNIIIVGTAPNYTVASITPTLTATGNATLSGTYPNQTIDVSTQSLSISGNTLNLSAGGGSIVIPSSWNLAGNAGTSIASDFIGTTDANALAIRTNNAERLRITSTGSISIGTTAPTANFDINTGNVKLGVSSTPFSIIKYGTLSNSILLSLGNNAGTISIPGAQVGDAVVVTLNNHNAAAGSISLNNAYISAANTLSYNINTSVGLIVTLNFSYILMRP